MGSAKAKGGQPIVYQYVPEHLQKVQGLLGIDGVQIVYTIMGARHNPGLIPLGSWRIFFLIAFSGTSKKKKRLSLGCRAK